VRLGGYGSVLQLQRLMFMLALVPGGPDKEVGRLLLSRRQ
jgi:hypothetical protein